MRTNFSLLNWLIEQKTCNRANSRHQYRRCSVPAYETTSLSDNSPIQVVILLYSYGYCKSKMNQNNIFAFTFSNIQRFTETKVNRCTKARISHSSEYYTFKDFSFSTKGRKNMTVWRKFRPGESLQSSALKQEKSSRANLHTFCNALLAIYTMCAADTNEISPIIFLNCNASVRQQGRCICIILISMHHFDCVNIDKIIRVR